MPYALLKAKGLNLYWVINKETGRKFSHTPLTLTMAKKQLAALAIHAHEYGR